jgi:hypothetical protein
MRRLFTGQEAAAAGVTRARLRWGEQTGQWRRIDREVYAVGPDDPTPLDRARAAVVVTGGVASGHLAGVLLGLDSITVHGPDTTVPPGRNGRRPGVRRRRLDPARVISVGMPCTDGIQTLVDLAASPHIDDLVWEQALESALRLGWLTLADLAMLEAESAGRPGAARIRRVLKLRPEGAKPTESLLETLMVQLVRAAGLPPPVRQYDVYDEHGNFVARVDLAWPEWGIFIELDGEHHRDQRVYDANRETAVVAATGWLCGRFTWTEVVRHRRATGRRLVAVVEQARRRPLVSPDVR